MLWTAHIVAQIMAKWSSTTFGVWATRERVCMPCAALVVAAHREGCCSGVARMLVRMVTYAFDSACQFGSAAEWHYYQQPTTSRTLNECVIGGTGSWTGFAFAVQAGLAIFVPIMQTIVISSYMVRRAEGPSGIEVLPTASIHPCCSCIFCFHTCCMCACQ